MSDKNQLPKITSLKTTVPFFLLDKDLYLLEASGAENIISSGEDNESSLSVPLAEALGLPDIADVCENILNTGVPLTLETGKYSVRLESLETQDTRMLLASFIEREKGLASSEDPSAGILEAMPDPVLITDKNGAVTAFNLAACHFFLIEPADMKGTSVPALLQNEGEKELSFPYGSHNPLPPQIIHLTLPAKGRLKLAVQLCPRPSQEEGWIVTVKNISRESLLEEREKSTRMKLTAFNENLRRLTSLASHDMKEPLVITSIYAELLLEKNRAQMDQESAGYVASIMDMVKRMVTLIDNLVALVRMDTTRPLVPVDAGAVCDEAIKKCKALIEKTGVPVSRGALPQVMASKVLLTQLFYHVISNAVKFSTGTQSEVRVEAEDEGADVRISVTDRGAGFENSQAEKIFELFERLHDKETYPGFGTGLTLARKIALAHGGRIWAESSPGKGSIFHFTLKKA